MRYPNKRAFLILAMFFIASSQGSLELTIIQQFQESAQCQCINFITKLDGRVEYASDLIWDSNVAMNVISVNDDTESLTINPRCPFFIFKLQQVSDLIHIVLRFPILNRFNLAHIGVIVVGELQDQVFLQEILDQRPWNEAPNMVLFTPIDLQNKYFAVYGQDLTFKNRSSLRILDVFKTNGLVAKKRLFDRKRNDLRGEHYEAATFILPPFTRRSPDTGEFSGLEVNPSNLFCQYSILGYF